MRSGAALAALLLAAPCLTFASWAAGGPPTGRPGPAPFATTDHFTSALACARCHDRLQTTAGEPLPLVAAWRTSLMAHSFVEPLWQAKVRSETLRNPQLDALIEDKCATCHAPMAHTEAGKAGASVLLFGESGLLDPDHPLHAIAVEGVGCTLCHQIQATDDLGSPASASGGFSIADADAADGRRIHGPFADPFRSMVGAVDYLPVQGTQTTESALCATCHDLETPYVDAQGNVVSTADTLFPEQSPYVEWLHSDFRPGGEAHAECQSCHMTVAGDARIASAPPWLPVREGVFRHEFWTENTTLLEILEQFCGELGCSGEGLDGAQESGRDYLAGSRAVEVVAASLLQDRLEVTVRVVNRTGHKLPTGIPIRRVYLHATVRDSSGALVFESGGLVDGLRIAGVDADSDPLAWEPHHDLITSSDQVQVYEGIMGSVEGEATYTLLRAGRFLKDNRLPPAGFDPATAPARILPVGGCLTDDDFSGGSDLVTYRISDLSGSRYSVTVELLDQPLSYGIVRDLLEDVEDPYVARFARMLDSVTPSSERIAETSVVVDRTPAP